jgi:hypothetical protein
MVCVTGDKASGGMLFLRHKLRSGKRQNDAQNIGCSLGSVLACSYFYDTSFIVMDPRHHDHELNGNLVDVR